MAVNISQTPGFDYDDGPNPEDGETVRSFPTTFAGGEDNRLSTALSEFGKAAKSTYRSLNRQRKTLPLLSSLERDTLQIAKSLGFAPTVKKLSPRRRLIQTRYPHKRIRHIHLRRTPKRQMQKARQRQRKRTAFPRADLSRIRAYEHQQEMRGPQMGR